MALHPNFPASPYEILDPSVRWIPGEEELRELEYGKLLPPLVDKLRVEVKAWRDSGYKGASETSSSLLKWWFQEEHFPQELDVVSASFQYFFAQREAIETIIFLHDVVKIIDEHDLMRFDSSGAVSAGMFAEDWNRYVVKMATGAGKTKVLSLILAWCYFHKTYEKDSDLARNFLVIAPNVIVFDRLRTDFGGLKIFFSDPVLPEDGYGGRNWHEDFQMMKIHLQDDVSVTHPIGNIFLTNIHRVYDSNQEDPSSDDEDTSDYFLGNKPAGATNESKVDVGDIVRDIDEIVILNDEAHHIHDDKMAWFKSIKDIHNRLKMKGKALSLQVDVTATPRHRNGAIFVQTVSDYPLVEAIHQNIVKHPVLPDEESRGKLAEKQSSKYSEKYKDYLHLGFLEWKKAFDEHKKVGKKAVMFVMTDDTKNCDEVAEYLEETYEELKDSILVIHTKNNGDLSEASTGRAKAELEELRKAANSIDSPDSKYKAIVSVLMLKEGWDVKNVTTIVGLRPYSDKSNILPEQTLGRGLRIMYRGQGITEYVSVVGTDAFMDFVESIKCEGVVLERSPMGEGTKPKTPLVVEIDKENKKKNLEELDISIPVLTPRMYREYKNIGEMKLEDFGFKPVAIKQFSKEEQRRIVFRDIATGEITHVTEMEGDIPPSSQNVIGFFTRTIMKELRLFSGFDVLYEKVKQFIGEQLFGETVDVDDPNILRNLAELEATRTVIETFKKQVNEATVQDKGGTEIRDHISINKCRPFVATHQEYLVPQKSAFNRIVGDSHFELEFAAFLESCEDIISYAKNYYSVNFKIEYQNADGDIRNYLPDFFVKMTPKEVYIVETKGREDLDDIEKIKRLAQWCKDVNSIQKDVVYQYLYVKQDEFEKYEPKDFTSLVEAFSN